MNIQAEAKEALDTLVEQTALRINRLQANLDGLEIPEPVHYEIHPADQLRRITSRVKTISRSLGGPPADDPLSKAYRVGLETEVKTLQEVEQVLQVEANQLALIDRQLKFKADLEESLDKAQQEHFDLTGTFHSLRYGE